MANANYGLTDLLDADEPWALAQELAGDFRSAYGLPEVHQLGIVVPDAEEAARELGQRGIGPFFVSHGTPQLWREGGREKTIRGKTGLAYWRGLELELVEPPEGSEFYQPYLPADGSMVLQHVGLLAEDLDRRVQVMEQAGHSLLADGRIESGPMGVEFAYLDTADEAGIIVELIRWSFFGRKPRPPRRLLMTGARLQRLLRIRSIPI